jgi:hypothetical protein
MSRNSVGPRIRCRVRLSRSSAGSDLSSSKASISRAASFKAVRAASLDGGRRLVRRRLFRRCLAKTFSINEVSERRSRAAAFPAASFRLGSILKVICAVFFWRMIPTLLASQNQRYGSPICSLIPNQFGSKNRYSTLRESDAKRTAKRSAKTCRWKPDQNKEKPRLAPRTRSCGGWGARGQLLRPIPRYQQCCLEPKHCELSIKSIAAGARIFPPRTFRARAAPEHKEQIIGS